jgi:hypothetical protein
MHADDDPATPAGEREGDGWEEGDGWGDDGWDDADTPKPKCDPPCLMCLRSHIHVPARGSGAVRCALVASQNTARPEQGVLARPLTRPAFE